MLQKCEKSFPTSPSVNVLIEITVLAKVVQKKVNLVFNNFDPVFLSLTKVNNSLFGDYRFDVWH